MLKPDVVGLRDAIHVPIISVEAGQPLPPSVFVKLNEQDKAIVCNREDAIGIVDPFGVEVVKGIFWLYLFPDSVKAVKHVWQHDNIPQKLGTTESIAYIKQAADDVGQGLSYHDMMSIGFNYQVNKHDSGHHVEDTGIDWPLFWQHWANITGLAVGNPDSPFCCGS